MAKDQGFHVGFRSLYIGGSLVFTAFSVILYLYCSRTSSRWDAGNHYSLQHENTEPFDLLSYPYAWNHLSFSSAPPTKLLKIALFVKKWPQRNRAGGMERHAMTLHLGLAKRGHELHIFTTSSPNSYFQDSISNLYFHLSEPNSGGHLDQASAWKLFEKQNMTDRPFDVVHSESVGLLHTRAKRVTNLAASWHGIAYETIHSDIIQELLRNPEEKAAAHLTERLKKVVDEVKFFPRYAHHVATSDHCGDVLKRIYMIPEQRVHIILNGVNEQIFKPDAAGGRNYMHKIGISDSKLLVFGMAGRLVKDKGHPLMYEALNQTLSENKEFRKSVIILVAGDGPWGNRYSDLGSNIVVLGPLDQQQLSKFYNAIDIFLNPTLRAQGLDHTLLEAMLSGKPVMATKLASITGSVIVNSDLGYTFSPTVESLKSVIYKVWEDGKEAMVKKGVIARQRALKLYTANKMTAAYERLFLCISSNEENKDEYCTYRPPNSH